MKTNHLLIVSILGILFLFSEGRSLDATHFRRPGLVDLVLEPNYYFLMLKEFDNRELFRELHRAHTGVIME